MAAPATKRTSMARVDGTSNRAANSGSRILRMDRNEPRVTTTAPPSTKTCAKQGTGEEGAEEEALHGRTAPAWRVTATVSIAAPMNTSTATKDRPDIAPSRRHRARWCIRCPCGSRTRPANRQRPRRRWGSQSDAVERRGKNGKPPPQRPEGWRETAAARRARTTNWDTPRSGCR